MVFENLSGITLVTGYFGQRRLKIGQSVRLLDFGVLPPHQSHPIVQRFAWKALANAEIDSEGQCLSVNVIRDVSVAEIVRVDRCRSVDERRKPTHLDSTVHFAAWSGEHCVHRTAHVVCERTKIREAGSMESKYAVVIREAFGEPQLTRHVCSLEIKWLKSSRANTLNIPRMKKLVRHGADHSLGIPAEFTRIGDDT